MKFLATVSLAFIIVFAASCKKDTPKAKLDKIAGEYTIYRVEQLSPYAIEAWPNAAGSTAKFVITAPKTDTAIITLLVYDKNNKEIKNDPWYCKVTQNAEGEIVLIEKNYLAAFIRSGYQMDFVGYNNQVSYARKK